MGSLRTGSVFLNQAGGKCTVVHNQCADEELFKQPGVRMHGGHYSPVDRFDQTLY